jgi:4'-phosphopantetheinyl transferase
MEIRSWNATREIPILEKDLVHLYRIDTTNLLGQIQKSEPFPLLLTEETERFIKFRYDKDRYTFAISRFALRFLCANILGIEMHDVKFDSNDFGKLFLDEYPELQFNISHSGDLIILGFGLDLPLGVDVEKYNREIDLMELASAVFSSIEVDQMQQFNRAEVIDGFYNCWAKKESYIKAKGMGLQIPLNQFHVRIFDKGYDNLLRADWGLEEHRRWRMFNFAAKEDYAAACTCDVSIQTVECWDIEEIIQRKLNELKT